MVEAYVCDRFGTESVMYLDHALGKKRGKGGEELAVWSGMYLWVDNNVLCLDPFGPLMSGAVIRALVMPKIGVLQICSLSPSLSLL